VGACLRRCMLFVGNDSGLMHMAAAVGIPTLGLFGPSRDEHYAPWGPAAAVVRTPEPYEVLTENARASFIDRQSRMTGLSVDTVQQAVAELRARSAPTKVLQATAMETAFGRVSPEWTLP
jgi:ADP-heptose:LPS heptosyltransferase